MPKRTTGQRWARINLIKFLSPDEAEDIAQNVQPNLQPKFLTVEGKAMHIMSGQNVIGRLLNLEHEIKTVLSIYEISSNGAKSNNTMGRRENVIKPVRCSSAVSYPCTNTQKSDRRVRLTKPENDKETLRQIDVYSEGDWPRKTLKKSSTMPGSLATTKEAEIHSKRKRPCGTQQRSSGVEDVIEGNETAEWYDCAAQSCELTDSERPLRPPKEILNDISDYGNENYFSKRSTIWCAACQKRTFDCICRGKRCRIVNCEADSSSFRQDEVDDDESKESFMHLIKPEPQSKTPFNESARKVKKSPVSEMMRCEQRALNQGIKNIRNENDRKNADGPSVNIQKRNSTESDRKRHPEETEKLIMCHGPIRLRGERQCSRPVTAPITSKSSTVKNSGPAKPDNRKTMTKQSWNDSQGSSPALSVGRRSLEKIPEESFSEAGTSSASDTKGEKNNKTRCHGSNRDSSEENGSVNSDKESPGDQDHLQTFLDLKANKNLSDITTQKISEILEKNHKKMEEMRRSKKLAMRTVKSMKERFEAVTEIKNEMEERLEVLVGKNVMLMRELHEAKEAKDRVLQEWEDYKKVNSSTALNNKLQIINDENVQFKQKIQFLEQQLQQKFQSDEGKTNEDGLLKKDQDIHQMHRDKCHEYHILFRKQEAAYRKIVEGIAVLEKVIYNNKAKEKRLSEIKFELKRRALKTQNHLERLTAEKKELMYAINELRDFVQERQEKIHELHEEISKKDNELEKQKILLQQKSQTLEETNKELESIRKNSLVLEDQVKTLRISIENFDQMHQNVLKERQSYEELVQRVQEENTRLQEQLSKEKDSLLIKNKIIEDHLGTIKQLREKSDEMKTMVRKIQSLERLINIEREEKLQQQEQIEHLKWKKDELKKKVKALEADLLLAPQEVVRDLQKTQIVLHELEKQVQIKQMEWETLLQSLMREKEQACSVAAFATKKLIQTTTDLQRQSDAQKKLYRILTENLIEKKKSLHECNEKAKQNVRFFAEIENTEALEENLYSEIEAITKNTEKTLSHTKQTGILKKNRDWESNNPERLDCFSSFDLNE